MARDRTLVSAPGRWRRVFACCAAGVHNVRLRREKWCTWRTTWYFLFALTYINTLQTARVVSLEKKCITDKDHNSLFSARIILLCRWLKCVSSAFRDGLSKVRCENALLSGTNNAGIIKLCKISNTFHSVKRVHARKCVCLCLYMCVCVWYLCQMVKEASISNLDISAWPSF